MQIVFLLLTNCRIESRFRNWYLIQAYISRALDERMKELRP